MSKREPQAGRLKKGSPRWFDDFWHDESLSTHISSDHDAGIGHRRHYKNLAIFQPDYAYGDELLVLLQACKRKGLKVKIVGVSPYFPGVTLRIIIYRPQDEEQLREYERHSKLFVVPSHIEDKQ